MSGAMEHSGIRIFTDGSARQNPGPGGWGAIIVTADEQVTEIGGAAAHTTNNKMEMTAAIEALVHVRGLVGPVSVYTDSTYLVRGITQWIHGWRRRNWMTAEGQPVLNKELWLQLHELVTARGREGAISWFHVPGHSGVPSNERCDEIATSIADGKRIALYSGPRAGYDVDVDSLAAARQLAATTGRSTSRAGSSAGRPGGRSDSRGPVSYLSLVGGKLERHATWADCERRVRGVSGARFKKAMSPADEQQIARDWGCSVLPD